MINLSTGLYARQSIEKHDSVSIESQHEKGELLCKLNNWGIFDKYYDAGYSGSNMDRPDLERLLNDIKNGKIKRVIVYRLDRISRSIVDFANLLTLFEKNNVQLISSTENFDTSTAIGRAMVYIVMVFAQLERETITQRITDNYYFRAKQGLFMGGNCPLGYRSIKVERNNKKASILELDPEASELVKHIFDLFVNKKCNPNKIAIHLNDRGIKTQKNNTWSRNKVIRILKNPAYTPNSIDVYEYLTRNGYQIVNSPEDFNGIYGLGIFGKEKGDRSKRKVTKPEEQIVAIGEFPPIVSSDMWLQAQYKLSGGKRPSKLGTSQTTWLSGMMVCSICGHSMSLKYTKKRGKEYKYIHCRGRSNRGESVCNNRKYYYCDALESYIENLVFNRVNSTDFLKNAPDIYGNENNELVIQKNSLLGKVYLIDSEIKNYIQQIGKNNAVIDKYIEKEISELDEKKVSLVKEIDELDIRILSENNNSLNAEYLKDIAKKVNTIFKDADIQTKRLLVSAIVKRILLDDSNGITIEWYI